MYRSAFFIFRSVSPDGSILYSTTAPANGPYESLSVHIPPEYNPIDTFTPLCSDQEDLVLTIKCKEYKLSEILATRHGDPALVWSDGCLNHYRSLRVLPWKQYYVVTRFGGVLKLGLKKQTAQGRTVYRSPDGFTYSARMVYDIDKLPPHLMDRYLLTLAEISAY